MRKIYRWIFQTVGLALCLYSLWVFWGCINSELPKKVTVDLWTTPNTLVMPHNYLFDWSDNHEGNIVKASFTDIRNQAQGGGQLSIHILPFPAHPILKYFLDERTHILCADVLLNLPKSESADIFKGRAHYWWQVEGLRINNCSFAAVFFPEKSFIHYALLLIAALSGMVVPAARVLTK